MRTFSARRIGYALGVKVNWVQVVGVGLLIAGLIWIVAANVTSENAPSPGPEVDTPTEPPLEPGDDPID